VQTETRSLDTSDRTFVDLTEDLRGFVTKAGGDGLANVFVPHATAGVAIMETGSGSEQDLREAIDRLLPRDKRYKHEHGSKGHGADHVLPAFIAPSISVPVVNGKLALGTWQSVVLVDTNVDNPKRTVRFSFLPG
jgi:secondary thiamine-phosphate synthase enzyme